MKNLIFAITLILSINVCAQNEFKNTKVFVRVYDLQGNKMSQGKILSISDTSLQLKRYGESIEIPVSSIGLIKTKRSAGHNILIGVIGGAMVGALAAAPFAAMNGDAALVAEMAASLAVPAGILGGIATLFKNKKPKSYEINGDKVKWKEFKEMIVKSRVVARFNFFAN